MIKFYDSVEKLQFSFFHPESLYNKRIGFVFNGCEAPFSTFKNFVQNSDLFKENVFLDQKLTKLEHFTVYLKVLFYENFSNPKHKSSKLFMGIFYGYRH